jgi:acyl-CoA synthetase (AMP-forming)/AMP-acid ligase II
MGFDGHVCHVHEVNIRSVRADERNELTGRCESSLAAESLHQTQILYYLKNSGSIKQQHQVRFSSNNLLERKTAWARLEFGRKHAPGQVCIWVWQSAKWAGNRQCATGLSIASICPSLGYHRMRGIAGAAVASASPPSVASTNLLPRDSAASLDLPQPIDSQVCISSS